MKSTIFLFSCIALILSLAVVSAQVAIVPTTITTSGNAGQTISIPIQLNNTANAPASSIVLVGTPTANWLNVGNQLNFAPGEMKSIVVGFSIPSTATAPISAVLQTRDNGGNVLSNVPVTINVNAPQTINALSIVTIRALTSSQNGTVNITNTGNTALTAINLSVTGASVSFSANNFALAPNASRIVDINLLSMPSGFGNTGVTLTAKDISTNTQATASFTIGTSFCRSGPVGSDLIINNIDLSSSGDEDDEWMPLDEVTVEVEIENQGDEDIEDIVVELGLFDSTGRNQVRDLDFEDEDEEQIEFNELNDGDEETATFRFIVPADFDEGNYRLAVKVYSKDLGETNACSDVSSDFDNNNYESISIDRESDEGKFIAFDEISFSPSQATCGDPVTLSLRTVNIGEDDEDRVRVRVFNRELNIDQTQEIREGLDQGDDQTLTFNFQIPQNAADKAYIFTLDADYDYRSGSYRQSLDDPQEILFTVFGCGITPGTNNQSGLSIGASLASDAVAGENLVVRSTLRNAGTQSRSYVINARGYESWADLESISERIVTLRGGESKDVTFTFAVNDDAAGDKRFTIEASDGTTTETREVQVTLEEAQRNSLFGSFGNSSLIWILGIFNVLVIILIIVVAIRISRR